MTEHGEVWVCADCYFAHHYGAHKHEREATDAEIAAFEADDGNTYHARQIMGLEFVRHANADGLVTVTEWFAGESDQRCEGGEPLGALGDDVDVADNTCSDHFYGQAVTPDDWDGEIDPEPVCEQCGGTDWEDGMIEFTWRSCDGCNSNLGGARYRLAVFQRQEAT